jgi:PAS domain S-box-containing protein
MQNQKVIEQLGYSPREAKVYLAALAMGEAHISDIAEKVKIPRSSVQVIVDKLHEDGLMNFYVMRRYKYWVAENPEQLLKNIKKREETIQAAMPALTAMKKSSRARQKSRRAVESLGPIRLVADAALQPILVANSDMEIEYVNTSWEKQYKYSLNEVQGENLRMFDSEETPGDVYVRMLRALEEHKLFQSDEIVDKKKNGTLFNLLTTIFELRYGDRLYYIQILENIPKHKRIVGQ